MNAHASCKVSTQFWKRRKRGNTMKNGCSEDCVVIPSVNENDIPSASFSGVTITPYAIQVNKAEVLSGDRVRELKVIFADGEEYTIENDNTLNYYFAVNDLDDVVTTFLMNRLVDVENITSVIVNGIQIEN